MTALDWQRLFTTLLMPLPFSVLLLFVGAFFLLRWSRMAITLMLSALLLLVLASNPLFASMLMARLEAPYPPTPLPACDQQLSSSRVIVVLGGGMLPTRAGDVFPRMVRSSDRVWHAARLWRQNCAAKILVSAGGEPGDPYISSEAEAISMLLRDLSVPAEAILLEQGSLTTQQNARNAGAMLKSSGISEILLVTSAWHMKRALHLFDSQGLEVVPAAADYHGFINCRKAECWMPSVVALGDTGLALKEHLGYWVQVWFPSGRN